MPYYNLLCDSCDYKEEYFFPFSAWDKLDLSKGETPYPKTCPKCGSAKFQRSDLTSINGKIELTVEGAKKRALKQVQEDLASVKKGNENLLYNIAGEKANPLLGKDVKYMKDVKKSKIKRRPS